LHAKDFRDLDLFHAAVFEERVDTQRELRFEQLLFGIGNSKVCKNVSAALSYVCSAAFSFLCFRFDLNFFPCNFVSRARRAYSGIWALPAVPAPLSTFR
jgi:hypothetical protein